MGSFWSVLIGVVALGFAVYLGKQSIEYRRDGVVVVGTVKEVQRQISSDGDGPQYSERYVVVYTPQGQKQALTMRTGWHSGFLFGTKAGSAVKVRYLPQAPQEAREDSWLIDIGGPIALVLLGIGGLTGRLQSGRAETVWWRSGGD